MTDHYLEQLRHQLAQTRAELRRAEDELAVHRRRASRETRLRLAWQSARRRANWQRAILADYRTEAVAKAEKLMRERVRQELNVVKVPIPADMVDLVAIAREQQDRALAHAFWNAFLHGTETAAPQPAREHRCRVWEDEGEWNVSCLICDAYVDNVGNETDAEEWAEDHLEFGNQACGCWHSGCGHATTEPQL